MEHQKIYLLDNTPNQPSTFRIKNWIGTNDDVCVTCNTNSLIKFKTILMLQWCKYTRGRNYNNSGRFKSSWRAAKQLDAKVTFKTFLQNLLTG